MARQLGGTRAWVTQGPGLLALAREVVHAEEAIRLASELPPDAVLMDLQMPGMGVIEATRAIVREHPHIGGSY